MGTPPFSGVGVEIKKLRKMRGLSQRELAEKIGISRSALNRIENNSRIKVSQDIVSRIASVVGGDLVVLTTPGSEEVTDLVAWFSTFVRRYPEIAMTLRSFANRITEAEASGDKFLLQIADDAWHRALSMYSEVLTGTVNIEENSTINIWAALLQGAKTSILATSCLSPQAWWLSPVGKYYQSVNIKKVKEQEGRLRAERIFVFASRQEAETSWDEIIAPQLGAGIHIWIGHDLPPGLAIDFYIVDGVYVGWLHVVNRELIQNSRFSMSKNEVMRAEQQFEAMKDFCKEINNEDSFKRELLAW
jgi:transcriptional regulator with XRE-family HTH domain